MKPGGPEAVEDEVPGAVDQGFNHGIGNCGGEARPGKIPDTAGSNDEMAKGVDNGAQQGTGILFQDFLEQGPA